MSEEFWNSLWQAIEDMGNKGNDYLSASTRDRPYDGQPQTDDGERGKQEVYGVTMRDVKDAICIGFFQATPCDEQELVDWCTGKQEVHPNYFKGTIYDLDLSNIDPLAVIQNACCELENRMGIWPNLPGKEPRDRDEEEG